MRQTTGGLPRKPSGEHLNQISTTVTTNQAPISLTAMLKKKADLFEILDDSFAKFNRGRNMGWGLVNTKQELIVFPETYFGLDYYSADGVFLAKKKDAVYVTYGDRGKDDRIEQQYTYEIWVKIGNGMAVLAPFRYREARYIDDAVGSYIYGEVIRYFDSEVRVRRTDKHVVIQSKTKYCGNPKVEEEYFAWDNDGFQIPITEELVKMFN